MTEREKVLEKRIEELERRVGVLMKEICPKAPLTDVEIYEEVDRLVQELGPKEAAKEINRRNRLRGVYA